MKYILKAYSICEFGQRKDDRGNPHQEDSIYPSSDKLTDNARTFILCDGMGGHDGGEIASATVCEVMGNIISKEDETSGGIFSASDFVSALNAAMDALDEKDNGSPRKMGTTMTFLKLHEAGATVAHIGDSRVYHIRPGKSGEDTRILFETEDHSLVNDLVKVGELTREEARNSRQKNIITRALQPNMEIRPTADIQEISDIRPGDYFYMCSDGMLEQPDMESGDTIRNIFSEKGGDDKTKIRILKSVTDNNKDNHTAFIIHILDVIGKSDTIQDAQATAIVNENFAVEPYILKDFRDTDRTEELESPGISRNKNGDVKKIKHTGLSKIIIFIAAIITVLLIAHIYKLKTLTNDVDAPKAHVETIYSVESSSNDNDEPTKINVEGSGSKITDRTESHHEPTTLKTNVVTHSTNQTATKTTSSISLTEGDNTDNSIEDEEQKREREKVKKMVNGEKNNSPDNPTILNANEN